MGIVLGYMYKNKRYKWKLSLQMETNDKLRSIKYKSELFLLTYINEIYGTDVHKLR